jgi:thiamine biosynthesis lipoprotein
LFDITLEPLTAAWGFGPVKVTEVPDSARIKGLLPCIGSGLIYWRRDKLVKKKPCVRLDLDGIAQGYSVDVLAGFLEQNGIQNYLVELGGEIRIKGRKLPGRQKMSVGIESPGDDPGFSMIRKVIWISEGAVTTSGNYRRYLESKGHRHGHLIDPRTGFPFSNELISVTVFAKEAVTADGFDNALMGMGLAGAMAFVEQRDDISAHFIYRREDGTVADTMSTRFSVLLTP